LTSNARTNARGNCHTDKVCPDKNVTDPNSKQKEKRLMSPNAIKKQASDFLICSCELFVIIFKYGADDSINPNLLWFKKSANSFKNCLDFLKINDNL